jgi:hypothetical protein
METGGCMQKDYYPELTTFEDVARHYLQERASQVEAEMEWFGSQSLTFPQAIERGCKSICENGSLHSHQWRPFQRWHDAPKQAADVLIRLQTRIETTRNFDDDLYPLIAGELTLVPGIGALGYYDIAHRIGAWLRPKLEPLQVYLHQGTRQGAKVVLGQRANSDRVPMSDFPEDLRQLTAAQLEDALCIYRGTLARIAGIGEVKTISHGIPRCDIVPAQPRPLRPGRC